jgi:hypothetical protein
MAAIFEEFANGEAFNASDFNTLAMRQAIIACDNQTDRDSILTPQEGMTVWRKDTNAYEVYSGSAWYTFDTEWQSWTPTFANLTIGNGVLNCKYHRAGKKITCRFSLVFGTTTSMGSAPTLTLPFTRATYGGTNSLTILGELTLYDLSALQAFAASFLNTTTTTAGIVCWASGAAALYSSPLNSANPFTWATGDELNGEFYYEAA